MKLKQTDYYGTRAILKNRKRRNIDMIYLKLIVLGFLIVCPLNAYAVDLIVHNAKITTLDLNKPEASAFAVEDGVFTQIGSDADILALQTDQTKVIDAKGRRIIPGLNDSHTHLVRGGRFYNLELRWEGLSSLERGLEMIAEQAKRTPYGQWVRVIGGWSPYQFEERRMPTPAELTEAAPETPVFVLFLYSQGFLNKAGVEALDLTPETEAPAGARYEFTQDGGAILHAEPNPTILYKTIAALPGLTEKQQVNSTRQFYRELSRLGLTSAIDAGGGGHTFPENYIGTETLAKAGEMPIRISNYLFPQRPGRELDDFQTWTANWEINKNMAEKLEHGFEVEGGGEFLVWSAGDFENFMAPRPDLSERENWHSELMDVTRHLLQARWPIRIHATYDESITNIMDVFEEADRLEKAEGREGFGGIRWAIDHAETVQEENMARIKALGGGIAVQSRMAYAGEYFAERYGAEAARQAPPIRKMLDMGIPVGAGTDGTRVSSYNPWVALYWLTTGKTVGGLKLYDQNNILSREEALRLFTKGSAWFSSEEDVKGIISPGQYADFAVLSDDYMSITDEEIKGLSSVLTVVGGNVEYADAEYSDMMKPLPEAVPAWSPVNYYKR